MSVRIPLNADVDLKTPPLHTELVGPGHGMEEAIAEAHEREARGEEATTRLRVVVRNPELLPDEIEWEPKGEEMGTEGKAVENG